MTRRILSFLALLALLVAPIGMMTGAATAAPHVPDRTVAAHCEGMAPAHHEEEQEQASIKCLIACAALLASAPAAPFDGSFAGAAPAALPLSTLTEMPPEAETPPPRTS